MIGGVLLMVLWRLFGPPQAKAFFDRRAFEHVPHEVAIGGGRSRRSVSPRRPPTPGCRTPGEDGAEMAGTLVLGYDGSRCAEAALEYAIEFAEATGDQLVIAFGYEPGGYGEEHAAHREEVREVRRAGRPRRRSSGRGGGRRGDAGADPRATGRTR